MVASVKPQQMYSQSSWHTQTCTLQLLGHVCDDGFGTHLEDQLAFDEGSD